MVEKAAKKTTAKKTAAKKTTAKKAAVKKTTAKKAPAVRKAAAKEAPTPQPSNYEKQQEAVAAQRAEHMRRRSSK